MQRNLARFLFAAHLFIILLIWYSGSGQFFSLDPILAIARLCGLLGVTFVLLQFCLIGRIRFLERAFGHDKLAQTHHTSGKIAITFILAHVILIITSYTRAGRVSVFEKIIDLLLHYPHVWKAFIAVDLLVIVVVTSLAIVRLRLKYETWYFVHLMTYAAILLAFGHQLQLGADFGNQLAVYYWWGLYIVILGGFVGYRWLRPLYLFGKYQWRVVRVEPDTNRTTCVYISGRDTENFPREAGQFMILRFLDKKRWWQAHPFSLSWGPSNSELRVTIKNSGDFTSEIGSIKVGTKIFLDGPYGIFTKRIAKKKKILFLAGGIGITPIRSLIEEMGEENYDMALIYANTYEAEIALKSEITNFTKKYKLKVHHVLSETDGHVDEAKIKEFVGDVKDREVYVCGPVPFMDAMIEIVKKLGVKEDLIHFEKFSLH